ncbi:MAG: hypothetical protein ACK5G9_13860, partial [Akkermansiaceae bacterium]
MKDHSHAAEILTLNTIATGRLLAASMIFLSALCSAQTPEPEKPTVQMGFSAPFVDNAIIQQQIPLPVWGTTEPEAKVTLVFKNQTKITTAQKDGSWKIVLDAMPAERLKSVNDTPTGDTLTVTFEKAGVKTSKEARNVVLGDVWFCAGQSNMAGGLRTNKSGHYPEDTLEKANYPALRQYAPDAQSWLICTPETAPNFRRTAFY